MPLDPRKILHIAQVVAQTTLAASVPLSPSTSAVAATAIAPFK